MISKDQLKSIIPYITQSNLERFIEPLNETLEKYGINTPQRIAAFIAQLAHESGSFRYVRELADGKAYEGRKDLGNTQPGDGPRYKGRGLIQITGRANYKALSDALGVDFVSNPELLEGPLYACLSAGWFWSTRRLNELADIGDFKMITKKINGGFNGYIERQQFYMRAKTTLGI